MKSEEHMQKAEAWLVDANVLLENQRYQGVGHCAYYAAFESVRSVLVLKGVSPAKTHQGVNNQFYEHFVKVGIVASETASALSRLEDVRMSTDYVEVNLDVVALQDAAAMAVNFVSVIRSVLLRMQAENNKPNNTD